MRTLCAYSFNEKKLESYKTIHFKGIKPNPISRIWEFLSKIEVSKSKVKFISFVSRDILEMDIFESYESELTSILESAFKITGYADFIIKRIRFDAMDPENIKNPEKNCKPKEIFEKRMSNKIMAVEKIISTKPSLKRYLNYVKL